MKHRIVNHLDGSFTDICEEHLTKLKELKMHQQEKSYDHTFIE